MIKNIIIFIILFFCFACKKIIPAKNAIDYSSLTNSVINQTRAIDLQLDSIRIYTNEENALCSMDGDFFCIGDTICFADEQLGSILFYDKNGKFLSSKLERGRGPNEILSLINIVLFPNRNCAILDGNWFLSIFNPQWEKINQSQICWYKDKTHKQLKELAKTSDLNESSIYSFEYEGSNMKYWGNKYLIMPINTELPNANAYLVKGGEHYYKNAYTLGIVDIDSGQIHQLMCPRSPIYTKYRFIPNFRHAIFDVNEDTLSFSFQADSLIYKIILPNNKPIKAYGLAGRNMKINYPTTTTFEESDDNFTKDRTTYGYYRYLKCIPETNLLFRGYYKGNDSPTEGLQVYRGHTLIYDFNVPKDFEIFGYKEPYYYAKGPLDYDREEMIVYKFKLEKKI